jgi:DNA polymerase-1
MKKFLLTDGNSMLFRAYYATAYGNRMTTSKGVPTNAVFGFLSMLQKAVEMIQPDEMLVAFDAGKHTFRHDLYADYKGGRKPAPDDLVPQFAMVRQLLDAWHIRWVEMPDIEADDLIGTASKMSPDTETYILTSDHDMLQLADETTSVLIMKKGLTDMDVMTPEKIQADMGVTPHQIIDLKGLMGDTSDNYPGIPGVGEKTAVKLLKQYGSVEGVLEHENEIKGALGKKVIAGHDSAVLSKKLAEIRRDVKLDFTVEECGFQPDYDSLIAFLKSLDMNAMAARFAKIAGTSSEAEAEDAPKEEISMRRVARITSADLQKPCTVFLDEDHRGFMEAKIHGFAFDFAGKLVYISLEDAREDAPLLEYLKAEEPHKTGYDIKRDMHLLEREGIEICFYHDAMILASLANSTLTSTDKIMDSYGLSTDVKFEDVYGKANKPQLVIDEEKQMQYACETVHNISRLAKETEQTIEKDGMHDLYRKIEMPLTSILCAMEDEGIRCDVKILGEIADKTKASLDDLQKQIYELAGKEFNINSPKQLAGVLYDDLGLPGGQKRSTAADKLEKLADYHPIVQDILSYRKLNKIYGTYAEGLKKYIWKDGKIHTIYNQCATQTGRLSSSDPNLQNISVRDEQGKEIRRAFLPEEGCVLMSCDYHQIELRMLAHMANEKGMIEAFREGIDAHTKTAMDVFGVNREEVTPEMRRRAKTVNFGVVYGISDFGLAKQLGISNQEAHAFIEKYYERYPGIRTYMDNVVKECEEKGYVTTLCGRRREIPEIRDKNRMVREFGKRAAMNAPIQGSAADLIKIAMIHIDKAMKEAGVKAKMILQVHDELIFNVPEEEVDEMKKLVEEGMAHAMDLQVPLTSETAIGHDWYEAK